MHKLLVDGYNLLFASNVFAGPNLPPTLENTRVALLDFLASKLSDKQRRQTTIVFDAAQAPAGLPHSYAYAQMQIRFSRRPQSADDLLEHLIADLKGPRHWFVVSSDHRVQRAARQRGMNYGDSDVWLRELTTRPAKSHADDDKPSVPFTEFNSWTDDKIDNTQLRDTWNPFPPGYAEDVLDEDDR